MKCDMWVAACDDDTQFIHQLSLLLPEILNGDDHVSFFSGGTELLDAARNARSPIDVLLLDMEMPGLSGIETALELRSISKCTSIIVLTSYTKYALSCFGIRAFHYLLKPLRAEQLKSVIDEARSFAATRDFLHISTREEDVFIAYNDIFYIESIGRNLYIHTRGYAYKSCEPIHQAERVLEASGFFRIHKSYIVNMEHVGRIDKSARAAWLSDGTRLPVGNRKQKDFISALLDYRKRDL